MLNYVIRNIDPQLWDRMKKRAEFEGRSLRFVLLALARVYAEHGYTVVETFDRQSAEGRRRE